MLNMSGMAGGQGAGGGAGGMSLQQLLSMLQGSQTANPGGQGGGGIGANTSTPMSNYMAPIQANGMPHQQAIAPMAAGAAQQSPGLNTANAMSSGTGNLMQLLSQLKQGQTGVQANGTAGGPSAGQVGQIAQGMSPDTMAAQMSSNAPIGQAGSPSAALAAPVNTGQGTGSTGTPNGMNPGLWDWLQKQMSGLGASGGGAGGMMSGGGGGL